jgi:23S rRNA-/tRNA-specific pseudouridylate synthase
LSQGDGSEAKSLVDLLAAYRREAEAKEGAAFVGLVHRLDRNVSGVVLTAKTSKAAARLARLFRERDGALEKRYLAWVVGVPQPTRGDLRSHLLRLGGLTRALDAGAEEDGEGGAAREAHLLWERRGVGAKAARLEVRLHTGVTHQIRAQLAHAGHPLLGDVKYGGPRGPRIALHAWRLAFPHPVGGARTEVCAPVPADLLALDRRRKIEPPVEGR